ncbi:MAG: methionine adenosyltransferase [Chloroflexi bacterium]|nr:methionine adenosyltransferase [Chloroflexota bacterium]|tara:strand:- start:386 stop:1579 length:1194 start_codon:yes stop_codon:yes gene_type:complete
MTAPSLLFTSESVTEGHPDKLCDQISDAILDEFIKNDPSARVACETAITENSVFVIGEITSNASVDIEKIVRKTILDIGYVDESIGINGSTCDVTIALKEQSSDIAIGVNQSFEVRNETSKVDPYNLSGAGDQGMMIGFACNETAEFMPLTISLSHQITRKLSELRHEKILPYLCPDGKAQVTIEYSYGKPKHISAIVISSQHLPSVKDETLRKDFVEHVINPICPSELINPSTKIFINPTGRFVTGGPLGDAGLTGRKIIVDTYGGVARHGGGAFSGKDPSKVDRSGAYAARHLAKNIVAAKIAERFEVQISYAIGMSQPTSIDFEAFGTEKIPREQITKLISEQFDLRPAAIIDKFKLQRPLYLQTASYGHFGRPDLDLPWEDISVAETLKNLLQ